MLSGLRDCAIIMWVMAQGVGWIFPDAYGVFDARSEAAYYEEMNRLGVWEE